MVITAAAMQAKKRQGIVPTPLPEQAQALHEK